MLTGEKSSDYGAGSRNFLSNLSTKQVHSSISRLVMQSNPEEFVN